MTLVQPQGQGGEPTTRIERFDDRIVAVDTFTGGMDKVTAGYFLPAPRPALVECGPSLSIEHVIAGLHELGLDPADLAYLVVSHVHLDHAGGAGDVAQAFPSATVVVSELGARHLHDPDKLNASARRVYGDLMDTVYGACTPIDRERLRAVSDGDTIDLGAGRHLELLHTPGHAKHHIGVWDSETGALFVGDSVGVKLPGMRQLRPATPPPDFHREAMETSIRRYQDRRPTRVYLAHYGPVDPPDLALTEGLERLRVWTDTAEAAYRQHDELDHVVETLATRLAHEVDPVPGDPHAEERVRLMSGLESNAAGMLRYFRRRDEGTLTPVG